MYILRLNAAVTRHSLYVHLDFVQKKVCTKPCDLEKELHGIAQTIAVTCGCQDGRRDGAGDPSFFFTETNVAETPLMELPLSSATFTVTVETAAPVLLNVSFTSL